MYRLLGIGTPDLAVNSLEQFRAYSFNTGNLLFNYALKTISSLHPEPIAWNELRKTKFNLDGRSTGLIVPMANQLRSTLDLSKSGPQLSSVNVSMICIGLGIQNSKSEPPTLLPGTVKWLQDFQTKSNSLCNIATRGPVSSRCISDNAPSVSSVAVGCPSHFINPSVRLGAVLSKRHKQIAIDSIRVAVCAGNPHRRGISDLENKLIEIVGQTRGIYIVQNPKEFISLVTGLDHPESIHANPTFIEEVKKWFPAIELTGIRKWLAIHGRTYISVPQWLLELKSCDLCIGTRIHGVQAALQTGIPAVCITTDGRTEELCEFMKVPHLSHLQTSAKSVLADALDCLTTWDPDDYDHNRSALAKKTVCFLESNGCSTTEHLQAIAAS